MQSADLKLPSDPRYLTSKVPLLWKQQSVTWVYTYPFSISLSIHGLSWLPFSTALVRIFLLVVP